MWYGCFLSSNNIGDVNPTEQIRYVNLKILIAMTWTEFRFRVNPAKQTYLNFSRGAGGTKFQLRPLANKSDMAFATYVAPCDG